MAQGHHVHQAGAGLRLALHQLTALQQRRAGDAITLADAIDHIHAFRHTTETA